MKLPFLLVIDKLGPWGLGRTVFVEKADVHAVCPMTFLSLVTAMCYSPPSPNGHRSAQGLTTQGK